MLEENLFKLTDLKDEKLNGIKEQLRKHQQDIKDINLRKKSELKEKVDFGRDIASLRSKL